ncbi:hypothetical protein FQZ97_618880 [compost metagenome]
MPHLPRPRREVGRIGASDVAPARPAIARSLPLEAEHRGGRAIRIGNGASSRRQHLALGRRGVADRRCTGRRIIDRSIRNHIRRVRQHGLQHAVGVLVDGHHAHGQAGLVGGDAEGAPRGAGKLASGDEDDVLEDARTGYPFDLPVVGHRPGDGAAGVVGIGDALEGCGQQRTHFRRHIVDADRTGCRGVLPEHQVQGAVAELQALDTGQAVGAIAAVHQVAHGNRTIEVHRPLVLGRQAAIDRGIQRCVALQDLPHDHQLSRVVGAIQHQRHHLGHGVEAGDFRTASVNILANADTHVQPLVTVDQVIATTAFEDIAAAAAEEDVAAIEEGDARPEEFLQPGDQRDVGQHAALGTCSRQGGGA